MCYRDGILYSGEWGPHCVTVIDARDMSALRTVATVPLRGYGDGVRMYGNCLYVSTGHHLTDETLPAEERHGNGHGVEIFDLTDPWNPVFVSRVGFDRVYSRYNDYWTPRPCSDGKYVICADSVNGLYVVDSSNPARPGLVSRVHFLTAEGKNIAVNSIAIAKGVVYAATWEDFGLVAFKCPEVYPDAMEKGEGPKNASYRFPYETPAEGRFLAWKPESGAPVRGVAARKNIVFAACSYGGLAILRKTRRGSMKQTGSGPMPFAGDVKVRGRRLYVAEGLDGLAVYRICRRGRLKELARFRDFEKDGPLAHCVWVYVPNDDWIVASTRDDGNYYLDMRDFPEIKYVAKIGDNPGWDRFCSDAPDTKGMYPAIRPYQGIYWVDLNKRPLVESFDDRFRPTLFDGVCRYKGDSFVTVVKGKIYVYSSGKTEEVFDMEEDFRGIPAWDGSDRLSFTCRVRGEIRMFDMSGGGEPRLLWIEKTDGYPETPVFWKGKLAVPCGYQGLLIEK